MASKKNKKSGFIKFLSVIFTILVLIYVCYRILQKVKPEFAQKIDSKVESIYEKVNLNSAEDKKSEIKKEEVESAEKVNSENIKNPENVTNKKDVSWIPTETENSSLYFGNPSNATKNLSDSTNYLMEKPQYTLSYNNETLIPNWVMWHLSEDDFGDAERGDDFRPDSDLPDEWYKVVKSDYQYTKYNFDRGHVCPSADRTKTQEDNSMTFLMTNMIPQSPDLNRQIWKEFESFERELVSSGKELYIAVGPYGKGGTTATGTWDFIEIQQKKNSKFSNQKILVPSHCWKIVLVLDEGENDYSRVSKDTVIISIFIPNSMGMHKSGTWKNYLTSVDDIEEKTGYDFFECLPDEVENYIESKVYLND